MADEFPVAADKLRKLIKKSRQMPIAFGFNPGTVEAEDEYLAAHARKQPEILGKLAKAEGAGTKAAYGTFGVDGSEVHLTCFQTVPQLAKKFKKYLKAAKITLNVVVMDPDGNVIDSDVEVLDDWFRGDDDDDDDDADGDVPAGAAPAQAARPTVAPPPPPPPPAPGQPAKAETGTAERAARIRDLQGRLAGLPTDIVGRVAPALMRAAQRLRDDRPAEVDEILKQVVAVLARVQLVATQAAQKPAAPPPEPPPQAAPADPRLAKLAEALKTLRDQAGMLPAEGTAALTALLDRAGGALDGGDGDAALAALREAQAALKAAQEAQAKWDKAFAMLEGPVAQALKGAAGDLKRMWDFAVNLAADGHWDRALATVPQIAAAVRQAATAPATATPTPEVPKDVVAFQRSRILWIGVRQKMLAEADTLRDAIIAQAADDADRDDIAAAAAQIATDVRQVDSRLQDILEQITVTPEGPQRSALKKQAAAIVTEYQTLIGSGLFTVIDANPFKPVSVASSAKAALTQISRTLAA